MYVRIFVLRICAHEEGAVCVDSVGVRICSSGAVSGSRGKQMTPAMASERNIFSKNHNYNSYNNI